MNVVKFYGYKKCGTCRKAELALQKLGVDYAFIDITETPPGLDELKRIYANARVDIKKLFNTSGIQYRELNIKERAASTSESEILLLLASNGRLIKRPIISDGKYATIGYNEEQFAATWGRYGNG